jgi:hypothetical protein
MLIKTVSRQGARVIFCRQQHSFRRHAEVMVMLASAHHDVLRMCRLTLHVFCPLQTTGPMMPVKDVALQGVPVSEHVTVTPVRIAFCMRERSTQCREKHLGWDNVNKIQLVSIL